MEICRWNRSKGFEFNVQLGLVNSKLSDYRTKNLQVINTDFNRNPSIMTITEEDS